MSDLTQTLKFFKVFCLRLVLFLRNYAIKHLRSNVWPCNKVYEPLGASNALSIHGRTQRLLKAKPKRNDKATTMHMQCKARKED
jgi:membrane-associated PAP2 superfamily phosphatase